MGSPQIEFGFYTEDPNTDQQIKGILESAQKAGRSKYLIWIHGGLVDRKGGEAGIPLLSPVIAATDWHPVLPIWESGLGTALRDVWIQFALRKAVTGALEVLVPFLNAKIKLQSFKIFGAAEDGGQDEADFKLIRELVNRNQDLKDENRLLTGEVRAADTVTSTHRPLEADKKLQEKFSQRLKVSAKEAPAPPSEAMAFDLSEEIAKWVWKISVETFKRWRAQEKAIIDPNEQVTKRPVGTLILDSIARDLELGGDVWTELKADGQKICGDGGPINQLLAAIYKQNPSAEVMLVGHSTGGVLINEILKSKPVSGKNLHVRLVASAATCIATGEAFSQTKANIVSARNITLTEEQEAKSKLFQEQALLDKVPLLRDAYTGSLLYAVSAAFEEQDKETPLAGMARFSRRTPDWITQPEKEAISQISGTMTLSQLESPTPANRKAPNSISATRHGDLSGTYLGTDGKSIPDPEGIRSIISLTDK